MGPLVCTRLSGRRDSYAGTPRRVQAEPLEHLPFTLDVFDANDNLVEGRLADLGRAQRVISGNSIERTGCPAEHKDPPDGGLPPTI